LTVIEERNLEPVAWYNNPQAPKYGEIAIWRINPNVQGAGQGIDPKFVPKMIDVHESRLIMFTGPKLTTSQVPGVRVGMGDSIYTRLKGTLGRYALGWNSAAILLNEFSLACMKIKGLAEMASQDGQKKLMTRMAAVKLGQSIARVTLLDKDEELTRDTAAVTGLAELLFALMQEMAGEADVPVTILMGMSPAGMNATGESDIRGWYDRIAGEWVEKVDPQIRRLLGIILRTLNGGKEPEKWCADLNPLWQESPKEKAETRKLHADTDEKNILNGLYSAEEARRSRFGGDEYGEDIAIDNQDDLLDPNGDPLLDEANQMAKDGALTPDPKTTPAPSSTPGSATIPIAAPDTPAQNAGFNGAQVESMVEIAMAVANGELSRESGKAILMVAFPINADQAEAVLGPENFQPKKPEPPPMAPGFGGAKPPIPPVAKPAKPAAIPSAK
jgi:hypothetical protein